MATLRVRDLMTPDPVALAPDDSLGEARDLMEERDVRHLPVVNEDGQVVGLVSHRDLARRALAPTDDQPLTLQLDVLRAVTVSEIMTSDVACVEPDCDLVVAAESMLDNKYGCLPVTEDHRLVGILTEADFVKRMIASS